MGTLYSAAQMTYGLLRLRLKGLIHRIPKTHRYTATTYGLKVAFFYAKLYLRILLPEWTTLLPTHDPLKYPLRAALDALDVQIRRIHEEATLAAKQTCFNRYDVILRKCLVPRLESHVNASAGRLSE